MACKGIGPARCLRDVCTLSAARLQVEAVANQLQGLRSEFSELLRASLANVSKRLESRQRAEA